VLAGNLASASLPPIITKSWIEFEDSGNAESFRTRTHLAQTGHHTMTIDWEVTLGFVDGRQDLLLELIDIFFTEHAEVMPHIAKAVEAENANDLQLYAHRYKGCLRYFGESEAGALAWQLESAGRTETLAEAKELLSKLKSAVDTLLPELRAYKQAHQQP